MTDFKPLKDSVWLAVKEDNVPKFECACTELMKRAVGDLFRVGWELCPKKIEDVYDLLDDISKWCHERWKEAMERGDAPYEDVSPGEGPLLVKKVIQDAIGNNSNKEDESEDKRLQQDERQPAPE